MSLISAAFGAMLNIILNFAMIPSMGAQGAGIATAISYFAVFVFRAIHSKSFMPFDLKAGMILLNCSNHFYGFEFEIQYFGSNCNGGIYVRSQCEIHYFST